MTDNEMDGWQKGCRVMDWEECNVYRVLYIMAWSQTIGDALGQGYVTATTTKHSSSWPHVSAHADSTLNGWPETP